MDWLCQWLGSTELLHVFAKEGFPGKYPTIPLDIWLSGQSSNAKKIYDCIDLYFYLSAKSAAFQIDVQIWAVVLQAVRPARIKSSRNDRFQHFRIHFLHFLASLSHSVVRFSRKIKLCEERIWERSRLGLDKRREGLWARKAGPPFPMFVLILS